MPEDLLAGAAWTLHGPAGAVPATVPGTVAATVGDRDDLDGATWEWRTRLPAREGRWRLRCEGLATRCDVLLDDRQIGSSAAMFTPWQVDLDGVGGELVLRFHPLETPSGRRPRARWRTSLVADQGLRWVRTTLLGRGAGLPRTPAPVGPWRPVSLVPTPGWEMTRFASSLDGTTGVVEVQLDRAVAGSVVVGDLSPVPLADGRARVEVPAARLWWPHTHGDQPAYDVVVDVGGERTHLGRAGFRTVQADRSDGGFGLVVNEVPVFVRGACWVPLDATSLQATPAQLRTALEQVREAGLNAVRVTGTEVYEQAAFFDLCDELGILVWQDAMLAGFDYPDDAEWLEALRAELDAVLAPLAHRPCLAVVSGGSETEQRPAMLGLDADRRAPGRSVEVVAAAAAQHVPGVAVVSSTPSGSVIAHRVGEGTAHWFGVGGYRRPLVDARLSAVRFAAECLAFGAPPDADPSPAWVAPRDAGAPWDFTDVTDHYVRELFGAEDGDDRWSDLSRAAVAECVAHVFAEWRRPASPCSGGLVLTLRDLAPGPGWGLVDVDGVPKSAWWALRRVSAPRAVLLTDEGLDGIAVHVLNDRPDPLDGVLRLQTWGPEGVPLEDVSRPVHVGGHDAVTLDVEAVLGGWRDVGWTHRFGPPTVDVVAATLVLDGDAVSRAVQLPLGRVRPRADPGLAWSVEAEGAELVVSLRSERLARGVVVSAPGWRPDEAWFTLPPGGSATVRLRPDGSTLDEPVVSVRHLDRSA